MMMMMISWKYHNHEAELTEALKKGDEKQKKKKKKKKKKIRIKGTALKVYTPQLLYNTFVGVHTINGVS